jgi:hypothetical protein
MFLVVKNRIYQIDTIPNSIKACIRTIPSITYILFLTLMSINSRNSMVGRKAGRNSSASISERPYTALKMRKVRLHFSKI